MPPRRKRVIGGRYEVGEVIGHGGMAEVHIGRDVRLGRDVAIKLLRPDLARDPTFQSRFRREAQSAASLNSPTIVAVYDTGEDQLDGVETPYIVMEYVAGRTLRDTLAAEGRLLPQRALEVTAEICAALEQAHAAGIVHRDIKPANVMITPNGDIKVMDFGIARALTASTATMTQTAAVVGTAYYLSPEQARGEHVDARSDVYSTGCLLYELLTGAPPFTGETAVAVAYQHVREDPVPPSAVEPEISESIDAITLVAMEKNPVNRYQSASEMRADIERALAGRPVHATPLQRHDDATMASSYPSTTVLLRDPPARRRRGTAYLILGVATIALFVVALLIARSLLNNSSASVNTPSLVGEAYGDAQATLQAQGLVLGKVTQQYTGKNDKGEVIAQQPPAGILDKKGAAVSLVISAGVQYVNVPAGLVGLEQSQAETALTANGFKIGQIISRNSGLPAGQVLATNPVSGQPAPAGSKIDLVVSNAKTKVPDVTMQDPDVATAILQQDGFSNILQKRAAVYSKKNDGLIVSQTPAAGTFATPDEQIIIYIDEKPPPPTNSPSPTTSPTITPSPGISTTPSITPSP